MAQLSHRHGLPLTPAFRLAGTAVAGLAAGCGLVGFAPAPPAATPPVANVIGELPWDGTGALTLTSATIDTTSMTVVGADLDQAWFEVVMIPGGEAAVLQADELVLDQVRAVGARPLILAARATLEVRGHLDGSGHLAEPGPGAAPAGPSTGGIGQHSVGDVCDSGGGGGGHASTGGAGGASSQCATTGGVGGAAATDSPAQRLVGGSSGGDGVAEVCEVSRGGAGGGVLQLSAGTAVTVVGVVSAGGGGGRGGRTCGIDDAGSGAGGGAGGTIFLQAPRIQVDGLVVAHGGGGGGGGNGFAGNGPIGDGTDGGNGDGALPAPGGVAPASNGGSGGTGGTGTAAPTPGQAVIHNGGGGGGAAGRVWWSTAPIGLGLISPAGQAAR